MPFNPEKILYTLDALNNCGKLLADQYPDAELLAIKQHNKLPDLRLVIIKQSLTY